MYGNWKASMMAYKELKRAFGAFVTQLIFNKLLV
jgi:hypothetical protein